MSLLPLGILSSSGGAAPAAFELISTQVLSSANSTVTFSSIVGTYKHLQIRSVYTGTNGQVVRFNSDSGSNYSLHRIVGDGSSVYPVGQSSVTQIYAGFNTTTAAVNVIDVFDYSSTSKYKTIKVLAGDTSNGVFLGGGAWYSTSAITSVTLFNASSQNFPIGSRFSLYGVKGS